MKLCGISRSSAILGSDSPQSNNRKDHSLWVTPFIPRERPNVKHAIAGYSRLPRPLRRPLKLYRSSLLPIHYLNTFSPPLNIQSSRFIASLMPFTPSSSQCNVLLSPFNTFLSPLTPLRCPLAPRSVVESWFLWFMQFCYLNCSF